MRRREGSVEALRRTHRALSAGREPFRVLHYIERWLPLSEQFVHGIVSHSAHPGVVVSAGWLENQELYPYHPVVCLAPVWFRTPDRARQKVVSTCLAYEVVRRRARLIHVHHGYRAYEVRGTVRHLRIPLVVSLHGDDVTGFFHANPHVYRGVLDRADAIIVPSQFLVDAAVAAGARPEATMVIPSGVDTVLFSPTELPPAPPRAVFVGRFVEKKGLDVLVEAWATVRAAVPEARLSILGYGPLEGLARQAGPDVEVVLRPDRLAVREAIRRSHVVVSPSRTAPGDAVESLLIVNLEAQASGRAVVTTDHGGIPEYVRAGETAIVVPENDAASLAAGLVALLGDLDLAQRLGSAGVGWARRFDVAACAARVDTVYESLVFD